MDNKYRATVNRLSMKPKSQRAPSKRTADSIISDAKFISTLIAKEKQSEEERLGIYEPHPNIGRRSMEIKPLPPLSSKLVGQEVRHYIGNADFKSIAPLQEQYVSTITRDTYGRPMINSVIPGIKVQPIDPEAMTTAEKQAQFAKTRIDSVDINSLLSPSSKLLSQVQVEVDRRQEFNYNTPIKSSSFESVVSIPLNERSKQETEKSAFDKFKQEVIYKSALDKNKLQEIADKYKTMELPSTPNNKPEQTPQIAIPTTTSEQQSPNSPPTSSTINSKPIQSKPKAASKLPTAAPPKDASLLVVESSAKPTAKKV